MRIDPTTVTTVDPTPALCALGYTQHPVHATMWTHLSRPKISVWLARGGDYMWRDPVAKKSGNLILLVRDIYPALGFPAALLRAQELLATTAPASNTAPNPAPSLSLPESAASAATDVPKRALLSQSEVERDYTSGAQIWTTGSPIPAPLTDRHITHIAHKFCDTFSVSEEDSVRIPGYGLDDDGQIGMVGYDTYRANGREYPLRGSRSGVSMTAGIDRSTRIVIVGCLIDGMAHDLIHDCDPRRGYVAVRTGTEQIATRLIRGLIRSGSPIDEIIISTPNDASGLLISSKVMSGLQAGPDPITGIRAHYVPPIGAEKTNADALRRIMTATSRLAGQIRDQIAARAVPADPHPAEYITAIAAE